MGRMTGWEALVQALQAEGVPYVFGLPGDGMHLYTAMHKLGGPEPVLVRHETSGAFMAMAFHRVTGQVAACYGCPGPGVTNLTTGILEAYSGCTPMIAIGTRAGMSTNGMGAFQEADHVSLLRPITKWAHTIEKPERAGWAVRRAITIATSGQPGPVYLEFPADTAWEEAEIPEYRPASLGGRPAPDPDNIAAAAELIANAERPLIVCGGGSILSNAGESVERFVNTCGVPIQVTPAGRGIISEHNPLFTGLVGLYRTTFPREIYEEADLLITLGSQMEEFQSGAFKFFPEGAKFIQIDISGEMMNHNWVPDVAIQADARLAIDALTDALAERGFARNEERVTQIAERREGAIERVQADADVSTMPLKGKRIVQEINRVFGDNTILVNENGGQDLWSYFWPYYQVADPGCCIPPAEETAMGLGVIGSIAAKLAHPDRQVVCTTGDSAFQMGFHELPTAVQLKAPVTWVVFNDGALGWVQWNQQQFTQREIAVEFHPPLDPVQAAKASGCDGISVNDPSELTAALERARDANQEGIPFVVNVPVDQSEHHSEFNAFYNV